jgi:anti-sigma factor RsiW
MNAEANHEKELLRLCGLMVDGGLEKADMERLSELLRTDASAREFYRGYMDVHARFLLHFEPVPDIDVPVEEPVRLHSDRESSTAQSSWWQFAASAALVLFTGLNVIQSAGNLSVAQELPLPPVARIADAEVETLADGIGIAPGEVKRMLLWGPLHD